MGLPVTAVRYTAELGSDWAFAEQCFQHTDVPQPATSLQAAPHLKLSACLKSKCTICTMGSETPTCPWAA